METFMPVLSHFENGNPWSASAGALRWRIIPQLEEEPPVLRVEVWQAPFSYEFSAVEETKDFPLTQEGLTAIPAWLDHWQEEMDGRPRPTLAELLAKRGEAEK